MKNFDKIIIIRKDEILLESTIQITSKKAIAVTSPKRINGYGQDTLLWIPKSLINIIDELKNEKIQENNTTLQTHVCQLPNWFLQQKNLLTHS